MLSDLPGDLSGNNPLVPWLNKLKAAVRRRTPQSAPGYRLREKEAGYDFEIIATGGGGGALAIEMIYGGITGRL